MENVAKSERVIAISKSAANDLRLYTGFPAGKTHIAYPLIEKGMGRWLEENMGAFFPYFRIDPRTTGIALGLAILLGAVAAALPAVRAANLRVVDALRRVA